MKIKTKGKINMENGICKSDVIDCMSNGKGNKTFNSCSVYTDFEDETNSELSDLDDPINPDNYDVVVNVADEIMIVMYEREGEPSFPQAFRTVDGDILLKRSRSDIILFDTLPSESFECFTKVSTILLNEIDDGGISVHVYDVPLSDQ